MSKKQKHLKFGPESVMRLVVFVILVSLAIGYFSNSKSNITLPQIDSKVLGDFSPKINEAQKWLNNEINKLKSQALDQVFKKIKSSILK